MDNINKTYKVNKDKCMGCGSCTFSCTEGMEMDADNKGKVISSGKVEECGGESLCPYGAIEAVNGVEIEENDE
jgi:ferredoxin